MEMDREICFGGKRRNKAKLRDGAIVEYDEAIEVDPENPEPRKRKVAWETKHLGVGKIIDLCGNESEKLYHLWEYLDASDVQVGTPVSSEVRFRFNPGTP